jgi:hypothetical protein
MITECSGEGKESLINKGYETEQQHIAMVVNDTSFRDMKL